MKKKRLFKYDDLWLNLEDGGPEEAPAYFTDGIWILPDGTMVDSDDADPREVWNRKLKEYAKNV